MLTNRLQNICIKTLLFVVVSITLSLFLSILSRPTVYAATFNPGRIIDDSKFTNSNSMHAADIDAFLRSKVPVCDTWHAPSQGTNPPYTCLRDYNEGNRNAANIINDAAKEYGINPQVILVFLQKEQGLITDTWPYPSQYRSAMGMGCPDSTPGVCDSQYYGFANQVRYGTMHLRNFFNQRRDAGFYTPKLLGNNPILWSPKNGCGSGNVNIVTRATSALYSYTPYQPNAAALNNLYGTGDDCSAYGNRNFWRNYNNWFGSTIDNPYSWEYVGQSGPSSFTSGQKGTWTVSARNTGENTWYNSGANPVRLSPSRPNDRISAFCSSGWITCSRTVNMNEASVAPGGIATFTFEVQAPGNPGTYNEYFNLLAEGVTWMNDPGLYFATQVSNSSFSSSLVSSNFPSSMAAGSTANVTYVVKNTGNTYWYNDGKYPIRLATYSPYDRVSPFSPGNWVGTTRPTQMTESVVEPGENATFNFTIKAPTTSGTYTETYSLLAESYRWLDIPISSAVTVTGGSSPSPGYTNLMSSGQIMNSGQSLTSGDGRYKLVLQGDGNLVLYSPTRALWSTGTHGRSPGFFVLQGDGNLVLYGADNRPYWASWTQGRGGNALYMQGDGNLVLYNAPGKAIWFTSTAGQQ